MVECLPTLSKDTGVVLEPGLVKVQQGTVQVNLINVHDDPIVLHKGRMLGRLEPIRSVIPLKSENKSSPRRKKCAKKPTKLLKVEDLPEHLQPVLNEVSCWGELPLQN